MEQENFSIKSEASDTESNDDISYNSDDDYMEQTQQNIKRLKTKSGGGIKKQQNTKIKIERMPTRRPDPKVSNRNALLARENRKRKKELVQNLENQFDEIKNENSNLKKMLKKQNNVIQKLNQEKLYLRSIISNRTEILSVIKAIKNTKIPITSSAFNFETDDGISNTSPSSTMSSPNYNTTEENGTYNDPWITQASYIDEQNFLFTDLNYINSTSSLSHLDAFNIMSTENLNGWENLLSINSNLDNINDIDNNGIASEHNYTNNHTKNHENNTKDPGVCLHVSCGRVSLEFCSSCNNNAQTAWLNEA